MYNRFLVWNKEGDNEYSLDLEDQNTLNAIVALMQTINNGNVFEVVRCKDCMFWKTEDCVMKEVDGRYRHEDGFCDYGKKGEQNEV